jgi:hypothetical protein
MILTCDVVSAFDPKCMYGKKGESVKLISKSQHVLIVEGIKGRFPVNENKVSYADNIEKEGPGVDTIASEKNNDARRPITIQAKSSKKVKAGEAASMPTLFG